MRIVLAGYGNVGRSFHRLLEEKREELLRRYSIDARVVAVIDRGGAALNDRGLAYGELAEAKRASGSVSRAGGHGASGLSVLDVLEMMDADVYVDATTSNFDCAQEPVERIEKAIAKRMHVVTSNKAPLALAMPALLELAEYKGVRLLYSGTVGGGTPFLSFASKSLRGNKVLRVRGVLNGTTNYVLYKMEKERVGFEEALRQAQSLGYAEADPSLDINGTDAAAKLVILVNHTTGSRYTLEDVEISGVEDVSLEMIGEADRKGKTLKLVADSSERLRVRVEEVDRESPLNVPLNLNAVEFTVEELGEVYLIGRGAGGTETAAALLRDLVELSS